MKRKSMIFFLALLIPALACGQFTLVNPSEKAVTVRVTLPDGAYGVRQLAAKDSETWYAFTGGNYKVEVLQGDEYINQLKQNRDFITDILLNEDAAEKPNTMYAAVYWLGSVQGELDKLVEQGGTVCTGTIPAGSMDILDPEVGTDDVTVVLQRDDILGSWSCGG